jgi:oligopeptide/dipeptide ABC transporter ATP-binding protein
LIGSIPVLGSRRERLDVIPGVVPSMIDLPEGCRFASRCVPRVENDLQICTEVKPDLREVEEGHRVRCWLYYGPEKVIDVDG